MDGFFEIFFALLTISVCLCDCATTNFSGKDITSTLFGSHNEEIFPVAYGDFNADKLTDVFAVTRDHSDLLIYFAHEQSPILHLGIRCMIRSVSTINQNADKDPVHIVGVSPGDFNGDGLLDVMVAFRIHQVESNGIQVAIFYGNITTLDCSNPIRIQMVQEPLMLDVNGDMIMDLFGEVFVDKEISNVVLKKKKKLWIFSQGGNYDSVDFQVNNLFNMDKYVDHDMPIPNSNAFVDTNSDLVPELVLITYSNATPTFPNKSSGGILYEVNRFRVNLKYLGDRNPTFDYLGKVVVDENNSTQVIGQSIFIDLNQNGKLMHLLPFSRKNGKNSGIKIISYDEGKEKSIDLPIDFTDSGGQPWHFLPELHDHHLNSNYTSSIVLRAGDFNLDGYPDLIGVLIRQKNSSAVSPTRGILFENVPCESKPGIDCIYPRKFRLNFEALSYYENVTLATFFDIHEDGLVDVLLVRRTNTDEHRFKDTYGAFAIQNSPDYDANFIKVMVLSPLPCPLCPKSNVPYGNIISGPVIEYKTTTQAGIQQTAVSGQMYRSSYMPLDLPYTIFGIGQSPNFIETLRVSVSPSSNHNHSQEWLQIIPNSQIFVVPTPVDKQWLWTAKLFLTPSKAVIDTFGVLLGFCGFIALLVGLLQYKEKREDRKERFEEVNRFHMM